MAWPHPPYHRSQRHSKAREGVELGSRSDRRIKLASRRTTCSYCNERVVQSSLLSHLEQRHSFLRFQCCACQLGYDRFTDIMDHFARHHGHLNGSTLAELVSRQLLTLPKDLRALKCRLCRYSDRWFLAQDRVALKSHVARRHNIQIHVSELPYSCRVCREEFKETESVLRHPCCELNGQNRYLPQPLIDPCDLSQSSETSRVESSSSFTPDTIVLMVEGESDVGTSDTCLYCSEEVPAFQSVSHKNQHVHLDFQCRFCVRSDPILSEIVGHLVRDHGHDKIRIMGMSPVSLCQDGLITFPADIRSFHNPEGRLVLAQNRGNIDVTYTCRACGLTGFKSSKALLQNHDCGLVCSGQYVFKIDDIPDFGPSLGGDLRCLICKFCGEVLKASNFRCMVQHLEETHHKFESSRTKNLEDFVIFGCTDCPSQPFKSVLQWDRHFTADFTECRKRQVSGASQGSTIKPSIQLSDEKDLRVLCCSLCDIEIHKSAFSVIADHLRQDHRDEIRGFENNLHLFAKFQCANCPRGTPVGENVTSWEAHFSSSSFRQCVVSAQIELSQAQELEGTTDLPDLRLLQCQVCQFGSNGGSFPQIWPHLAKGHGLAESSFGTSVRFGCLNCPNFCPPSVQIWERHFSSTYKLCQGSSQITGPSIRFWCDTCRETRTNFEAHLQGDTHKQNLSRGIIQEDLTVYACDVCPDILVTTEANLKLHTLTKRHCDNVKLTRGQKDRLNK